MNAAFKKGIEIIRGDVQTIITVSYILIVAVGMLFTHKKYAAFGIDIFEYADIFDFLIAPFSDFKIVLFSVITLFLIFFIIRIDILWRIKYPKTYSKMWLKIDKKKWYGTFRYLSFFFLLLFYLNISANLYGRTSKTEILRKPETAVKFSDNSFSEGVIIGKTKEVLFLVQNGIVKAIPIHAMVKEYEVK